MNRYLLLVLHTASLVLLFFGWTLDMLKIDISAEFIISFNLFNEKRSVLGTLQSLFGSGNYFPFFLILLFGIIVPLVKSGALYYLLLAKNPSGRWAGFVKGISKWAMADVFAISIFVAFLGAQSMEHTQAVLEPGFYYFATYVLLSAVIGALATKLIPQPAPSNAYTA
jgi:paraquat-inducible protein A